jgi:hypothetical protein
MNETGINNDEMDMISDNLLGVQSEANTAAIPVSNKRKAPLVQNQVWLRHSPKAKIS